MAGTPNSSTTVTGRLGEHDVDGTRIARMTTWSVSKKLATKSEWGDSDGNGFTMRAAGRKDGTISTAGKFDSGSEQYDLFQPEDIAAAVMWLNATLYYDFPRALCDTFDLSVNIETEEVIGWSAAWGADGVFYFPGEAGATSRSYPG